MVRKDLLVTDSEFVYTRRVVLQQLGDGTRYYRAIDAGQKRQTNLVRKHVWGVVRNPQLGLFLFRRRPDLHECDGAVE